MRRPDLRPDGQKVDFPKFIGELFQSVFQAIVEISIEQMHAYGELFANVAKTIDQFMADNITECCFPTLCGLLSASAAH